MHVILFCLASDESSHFPQLSLNASADCKQGIQTDTMLQKQTVFL